ncbi:MAG: sulfatase [Cyclobacteriaceae bacterium]
MFELSYPIYNMLHFKNSCGFTFLLLLLSFCSPKPEQKPNIIFIMSDDHTTQAFGVYGNRLAELNPTPTLDEFGKAGIIFDQAFCNNSICTPSRASIMTGQYPQTNGVLDLDGSLDETRQYLPKEMKALGYETAIIGKWHLKEEPAAFDYYKVLKSQGDYFDPTFRVRGDKPWPGNTEKYEGHSTDVITDQTLEWLAGRDSDQPFFLMHHYKAPHDMFEFAPRYTEYLADVNIPEPKSLYEQPNFGSEATRGKNDSLINQIGTSIGRRHPVRNYVQDFLNGEVSSQLSDVEAKHEAYQEYLKRYLRCVKGVDDNLARLFAYLKETGQWDNTIIIYTGDQGFMLGEHDYMDKRWMYEEAMRMPFLVHHPKAKKGVRSDLLINNTDYAPTMIELAGGTAPDYMQGKSFAREILSNEQPDNWRKYTYYRYWMHMVHHDNPAHFGIRSKDHKLIFYYGTHYNTAKLGTPSMTWKKNSFMINQTPVAWEFYDLQKDPNEVNNVYDDPAYSSIINEMKAELIRIREELNETDKDYPHIQKIIDVNW